MGRKADLELKQDLRLLWTTKTAGISSSLSSLLGVLIALSPKLLVASNHRTLHWIVRSYLLLTPAQCSSP